jgi:hypothetical protein
MQGYAEVVLGHERAHLESLKEALGNAADEAPSFDFGGATGSPNAFVNAAAQLEDVAVAAYNGQAGSALERIGVQA